jgi:5-methylcytosine-specific restriction endonuclease McrA
MRTYLLTHLSDAVLLRDLNALVAQERSAMAAVLAHIAEVDARRLYLPAGYPSMYEYCVGKLHLSEQAAKKRIRAGRAARRFPAIFVALAEGRMRLSAVVLLAPHLTPENAGELLAAVQHRTRSEIELLLAQRFPRPEMLTLVEDIPASTSRSHELLSQGTVEADAPTRPVSPGTPNAFVFTGQLAPAQVEPRSHVKPDAPQRFGLHVTIDQSTYDLLRYPQALLSHDIPSGDVPQVLNRALEFLVRHLEKQKFGATTKSRPRSRRSSVNPRHIPAHVKRAVWERDQGQCTFVGARDQRCPARKFLEFDHIDPVARGGQATVEGIRLLCRGHNRYEAERTFGAGFMSEKREQARRAAADARADAGSGGGSTSACRRGGGPLTSCCRRTRQGRDGVPVRARVPRRRGASCRRVLRDHSRRYARGAGAHRPDVSVPEASFP